MLSCVRAEYQLMTLRQLNHPPFTRLLPWIVLAWRGRSILKLEEFGLPCSVAKIAIRYVRRHHSPTLLAVGLLVVIGAILLLGPSAGDLYNFLLYVALGLDVVAGVLLVVSSWRRRSCYRALNLISIIAYNLFEILAVTAASRNYSPGGGKVWQLVRLRRHIRTQAWLLARVLAQICGRPKSEYRHSNVATLSKWICWASEDIHDKERVEMALSVCVDAIMQLTGPTPWRPLRLPYPPSEAAMKRPLRFERWARRWKISRAYIIPLFVSIVTALLSLLVRSWQPF